MLETMENIFDPKEFIEEFEALTKDAGRVQKDTLRKILEENGTSEYLQKWGLDGKTDPESFAECVPLATHSDLEPYIQRIMDGDVTPILTGKPIKTISLRYIVESFKSHFSDCKGYFFIGNLINYFLQLWHYSG